MTTQHQLQPLPLESRGGRRRCAQAASAAGDWKLRGVGATLPGKPRCADLAADVFVGCVEGHRSTASGKNLDRNRRNLSSGSTCYNPLWMSPVGCGVGSALSRICCCSSFPRLTGVISWYSLPQAHPACFADAQQLTGTERRRLKGEPGCDWPRKTSVMSVNRLMETESPESNTYMHLKLYLAFSFLCEPSLNRKTYKQLQRGGGQAFARSRFLQLLVPLSLGAIISLSLKKNELLLLISALSTSLARAVHSSATVLPPPLVTGCAAAAED